MIYDLVSDKEPLRQGDIFYPLPGILHFDLESLILINGEGELQQSIKWDEISKTDNEFDVKVSLQKLIGIVASQDCDAERNDLISFFQIDTFNEITSNQAPKKRKNYLNYLMEGSETYGKNKWFYLPESKKVRFDQKMAVDFEVVFQVPKDGLLANKRTLRKGRLNRRAMDHFQRTMSNYLTRYAHDKWYSLTKSELKEYNSLLPDGEKVSPIGEQAD